MMQVTSMWMLMTMPMVGVELVAPSFRQSHSGLKDALLDAPLKDKKQTVALPSPCWL